MRMKNVKKLKMLDPPGSNGGCRECGCGSDWKPGQADGELPRRTFLVRAVAAVYLAVSGIVVGPSLALMGAPLLRKKKAGTWLPVLDFGDISDGETRSVNYRVSVLDGYMDADRTYNVYLHREGDAVTAFDPSCPHLGCRVTYKPQKHRYVCPCHGGVFGEDGEVVSGPPPHGLAKIETKVEDGRIWLYRV